MAVVTCPTCDLVYRDEDCWTIRPHMPLAGPAEPRDANPAAGYCKEHDLFGCPFHPDSPNPTDVNHIADVRSTRTPLRPVDEASS